MNVKITREVSLARPTTTPLRSSVLDHAAVGPEMASFGLRNEEGLWPSYNCIDMLVPTPMCPEPLGEEFKTFSNADWVTGFAFAVYGAVQCSAVGLDVADQKSELARVFAASEGRGVEQAILANVFPTANDITPSATAGVPLSVALGLLEGFAAANYAGVPTIHMPRAAGSVLNERIVWNGDKAYTRSGSKIAFGGGYDDPAMLASGEWDLYATGEVYVEKSTEVSVHSYVLPGDGSGTGSDENGLADNTVIGLVERLFRVGVDCFVAKATGTVWS